MNKQGILSGLSVAALSMMLITPGVHAGGTAFTVAGSTQMYTLGALMANKYQVLHNAVNITVTPSTSQRGYDDTCTNAVAVGMSDIYIQDSQLREAGCADMLAIPVAVSSTAVVYNLPGANFTAAQADGFTLVHPVRFTADVLAGIYMGKIKKWNDPAISALNPGMALPAQAIRAFNSAEPGGSGFVFDQWLALSNPAWNTAVGVSILPAWPTSASIGTQASGDMVQKVKSTPYSLGFVGFDYAISNKMQAAALKNASGVFLTPSLNGLSRAIANQLLDPKLGMPRDFRRPFVIVPGKDAYNPADFEFFMVHRDLKTAMPNDPVNRKAIKDFLAWAISVSGGQQFIEDISLRRIGGVNKLEHGFVPVPPEIREASQAAVNSISV